MLLTYAYFLVPLIMVLHGVLSYEEEPKINSLLGYRTKRSLKNEETFAYANRMLSELFIRLNCLSLLMTVVAYIFYKQFHLYITGIFSMLFFVSLTAMQIFCCVSPFYLVERNLSRFYSDEGDVVSVIEEDFEDEFHI